MATVVEGERGGLQYESNQFKGLSSTIKTNSPDEKMVPLQQAGGRNESTAPRERTSLSAANVTSIT